jgi:hypothetical protein
VKSCGCVNIYFFVKIAERNEVDINAVNVMFPASYEGENESYSCVAYCWTINFMKFKDEDQLVSAVDKARSQTF